MSNLTDEIEAANTAASKMLLQLDAIHESLQGKLEQAALLTRVTRLRTDIDVAKRGIETITVLAQARGAEPDVSNHLRTLKEAEQELEELKAKYGLQSEDAQQKRWWEFWK
jgi:hypothetical protein